MSPNQSEGQANWTSLQAYILAVVCLACGIAIGYFFRGSASPAPVSSAGTSASQPAAPEIPADQTQVTPEQLRHMADTQAAPLLAQLRSSPNDPALLSQIGNVYYDTQNYREAIRYYEQSLKADPKNADVRTDLGTSYFYLKDSDRALQEFHTVLQADPKHAQTLFNKGMVEWQGKGDVKAAVASWEHLLQVVPDYKDRARVEQLIEQAKKHANMPAGTKTDKPATM
jgi:cytochrome c-type biogenesis protein CcmH/NrfG